MGIRKDIKKLIEDLESASLRAKGVYIEDVTQRLEEILRKNKKEKTRKNKKEAEK